MDRTLKSRVLTAADVMLCNEAARDAVKRTASILHSDEAAAMVAGIELMTQELLAVLVEGESE
jgi:predicted hotdog family 3-hydroxylacyl-ACP dehydratase